MAAEGYIVVINNNTNTVSDTITNCYSASGIAVSPDGSKIYVANNYSNTVCVINSATNTVTNTIAVGNRPYGISVSPDGSKVYVGNQNDNTVSVINTTTNTVTDTITVGVFPYPFGNFISIFPEITTEIALPIIPPIDIAIYPNPSTDNHNNRNSSPLQNRNFKH